LNVLGGFATFNINTEWNFDFSNPSLTRGLDFYSLALHEIGHALGLNARGVKEWTNLVNSSGHYIGENAIAAYNEDNDNQLLSLNIQGLDVNDYHWMDNTFDSKIFPFGSPNLGGTVGRNELQDLLMEPGLSFGGPARFEITNVDAAALRDIGWSTITEDPAPPPPVPLVFNRSADGGIRLAIPASEEGSTYSIQTSTNGVNWLNVQPSLIGNGSNLTWEDGQEGFTDPHGNAVDLAGKFYRVTKN
jgi:hypothetical protein